MSEPHRWTNAAKTWALAALGIVAIALGLVLGFIAVRDLAWGEAGRMIASVNTAIAFGALALFIVAGLLRGLRWQRLLRPERVSATRLFMIEQAGTALDTLSVVHVLDEVVETGILVERDGIPLGKVLATLAMQRTLEFATTVIVLGGTALFLEPMRAYREYLTAGIVVSFAALTALFTVGPALVRLPLLRRIKLVGQFSQAAQLLRDDLSGAIYAFALSVAQALILGTAGWLLMNALHIDIALPSAIAITLGVLFFGSTVPGLPMALGTYEFAAVSLFLLWDRPAAEAVSFTVLLRGLVYLPPLLFAAVFLPKEGLASLRALRQLARRPPEA